MTEKKHIKRGIIICAVISIVILMIIHFTPKKIDKTMNGIMFNPKTDEVIEKVTVDIDGKYTEKDSLEGKIYLSNLEYTDTYKGLADFHHSSPSILAIMYRKPIKGKEGGISPNMNLIKTCYGDKDFSYLILKDFEKDYTHEINKDFIMCFPADNLEEAKKLIKDKNTGFKDIKNVTSITIGYGSNDYIAIITNKDEINEITNILNSNSYEKSSDEMELPYLYITLDGDENIRVYIDENNLITMNYTFIYKSKEDIFEKIYTIFESYSKNKL